MERTKFKRSFSCPIKHDCEKQPVNIPYLPTSNTWTQTVSAHRRPTDASDSLRSWREAGKAVRNFLKSDVAISVCDYSNTARPVTNVCESGDAMNEMLHNFQSNNKCSSSHSREKRDSSRDRRASCSSVTVAGVLDDLGINLQQLVPCCEASTSSAGNSCESVTSSTRDAYVSASNSSGVFVSCDNCSGMSCIDPVTPCSPTNCSSSFDSRDPPREGAEAEVRLRRRNQSKRTDNDEPPDFNELLLKRKDLTSLCSTADATDAVTSSQENLAESVSSEDDELCRHFHLLSSRPQFALTQSSRKQFTRSFYRSSSSCKSLLQYSCVFLAKVETSSGEAKAEQQCIATANTESEATATGLVPNYSADDMSSGYSDLPR